MLGPAALADEVTQRSDQLVRLHPAMLSVQSASCAPRNHFRELDLLVFVSQLCNTGIQTAKLLFRFMM